MRILINNNNGNNPDRSILHSTAASNESVLRQFQGPTQLHDGTDHRSVASDLQEPPGITSSGIPGRLTVVFTPSQTYVFPAISFPTRFNSLKKAFIAISIGNTGAPTDNFLITGIKLEKLAD
jgi:hypothetical protein